MDFKHFVPKKCQECFLHRYGYKCSLKGTRVPCCVELGNSRN